MRRESSKRLAATCTVILTSPGVNEVVGFSPVFPQKRLDIGGKTRRNSNGEKKRRKKKCFSLYIWNEGKVVGSVADKWASCSRVRLLFYFYSPKPGLSISPPIPEVFRLSERPRFSSRGKLSLRRAVPTEGITMFLGYGDSVPGGEARIFLAPKRAIVSGTNRVTANPGYDRGSPM